MSRWWGALLALVIAGAQAQPLREEAPSAVVDRFHAALKASDPKSAIGLLAPDLVVFETGFAEPVMRRYVESQLANDLAFAVVTQRRVIDRSERREGDLAWVLTVAEIRGQPGGEALRLQQTETALLRRYSDGWKIAHIHWSAHPKEE